jgi:hypothetical protein
MLKVDILGCYSPFWLALLKYFDRLMILLPLFPFDFERFPDLPLDFEPWDLIDLDMNSDDY